MRIFISDSDLSLIAKQIICRHSSAEGGNDYLFCPECELTWDYAKATPSQMLAMYEHPLITAIRDSNSAARLAKVVCLYRWEVSGRWSYCIHDKGCPGCVTHDVGHAEMTAHADQYKLLELAYRIKTEQC